MLTSTHAHTQYAFYGFAAKQQQTPPPVSIGSRRHGCHPVRSSAAGVPNTALVLIQFQRASEQASVGAYPRDRAVCALARTRTHTMGFVRVCGRRNVCAGGPSHRPSDWWASVGRAHLIASHRMRQRCVCMRARARAPLVRQRTLRMPPKLSWARPFGHLGRRARAHLWRCHSARAKIS